MQRLWLITNPASGSASDAKCATIEAAIAEAGFALAGRTLFPERPLPTADELDAARADIVALFAGDGTINAAACALDRWAGRMLVLPGGTMNMLARAIHGSIDGPAIVHAAARGADDIRLPYVEAGPHRAFVALIIGPVAAWAHAREAVRAGRFATFRRAVRLAFHRSLSRGITVSGAARARQRQHAVVAIPGQDAMEVSAIGFDGWMGAARLGMTWLTGDWRSAPHVAVSHRAEATVSGTRSLHALFDGEEAKLRAPVRISHGHTRLLFITTQPAPAAA